jgi:hypothetical protein
MANTFHFASSLRLSGRTKGAKVARGNRARQTIPV